MKLVPLGDRVVSSHHLYSHSTKMQQTKTESQLLSQLTAKKLIHWMLYSQLMLTELQNNHISYV